MTTKRLPSSKSQAKSQPDRWYFGADVPNSVIRRYAREVAEKFHPQKIILFGSYAYGQPNADSDVDILVIMPCRNEIDQAVKIDCALERCFALDLIVRKPHDIRWRLAEGDDFIQEIVSKGKVLYEAPDDGVGRKSRNRLSRGKSPRPRSSSASRASLFPLSAGGRKIS
jgi:predicted nucleotidyltransferase